MIWQYGDKIPSINDEKNRLNFPNENRFGLLTNNLNSEVEVVLGTLYTIEKVNTFDLNWQSKTSKKYNERLSCDYYLLTKR
jgi:hypothetical protein